MVTRNRCRLLVIGDGLIKAGELIFSYSNNLNVTLSGTKCNSDDIYSVQEFESNEIFLRYVLASYQLVTSRKLLQHPTCHYELEEGIDQWTFNFSPLFDKP